MERYRIGDFARKLGVTPDFLKYCERKGIISAQVEKNGYRYYEFTQAARLLEYIKLKNQGYTAEEIRDTLHESSYVETIASMQEKKRAIQAGMRFDQALLEYYDEMTEISANFGEQPVWQVRRCEGFYFLPHSVEHRFIEDESVFETVRAWNAYMPVVCSTYKIAQDGEGWLRGERGQNVWGFSVGERMARRLGMPTCGPVEYVKPGRTLEVFSIKALGSSADMQNTFAREIMEKNGFALCGDAYNKVIFKIFESGVRREYGVLCIPIEG